MSSNLDSDFIKSLESDEFTLPVGWMSDEKHPGANIKRYLQEWPKYQEYYTSRGIPCYQVIEDAHSGTMMQPCRWSSLQLERYAPFEHEVDAKFVTMFRHLDVEMADIDKAINDKANVDQQVFDQAKSIIIRRVVGDSVTKIELMVVPMTEHAPPTARDAHREYRDIRQPLGRPQDVLTYDNPVKDADHFLAEGINLVHKSWTDHKWSPGNLFGPDGSNPDTRAQSASYAPSNSWDQVTDSRTATSTGHLMACERPPNVGVGWGGYDKFDHWQESGRRVKGEMVEDEDWSMDRLAPVTFVKPGSGEIVETIQPILKEVDLPLRHHKPDTLYELVNKRAGARKAEKSRQAGLEWEGPSKRRRFR